MARHHGGSRELGDGCMDAAPQDDGAVGKQVFGWRMDARMGNGEGRNKRGTGSSSLEGCRSNGGG